MLSRLNMPRVVEMEYGKHCQNLWNRKFRKKEIMCGKSPRVIKLPNITNILQIWPRDVISIPLKIKCSYSEAINSLTFDQTKLHPYLIKNRSNRHVTLALLLFTLEATVCHRDYYYFNFYCKYLFCQHNFDNLLCST